MEEFKEFKEPKTFNNDLAEALYTYYWGYKEEANALMTEIILSEIGGIDGQKKTTKPYKSGFKKEKLYDSDFYDPLYN